MPEIRDLPEADVAGFRLLREVDDAQVGQLRESLGVVERYLTTADLLPRIEEALEVTRRDAKRVRDALMGLVAQQELRGDLKDEIAHAVARFPKLEIPAPEREAFAARLNDLSATRALRVAYKALDVITEHERVFHDARVFTDLRPVFTDDVETAPSTAVIVEMLKVEYHTPDGERNACYFALDRADLLRLREVIGRALTKTASVRDLLSEARVTYWEYEEPDASGR